MAIQMFIRYESGLFTIRMGVEKIFVRLHKVNFLAYALLKFLILYCHKPKGTVRFNGCPLVRLRGAVR